MPTNAWATRIFRTGELMRRRRFVGFVLTAAATVLAGQAWTSPATARPVTPLTAPPAGVSASTSVPLTAPVQAALSGTGAADRQEALAKYWTADRMRAAISADRQPGPPARVGPSAPQGGTAAASPAAWAPSYPASHPVARTYGKVFFTNTTNGYNYVCSATVVNY